MKQIKLNEVTIEISDEKYEELLKSAKPETKRWKPESKYWFINDASYINWDQWNNDYPDHSRYDLDNCFKTKEDAIAHRAYLEAMTRIKYSSEFTPDWSDDNQDKWYIYYNHDSNELYSATRRDWQDMVLVYYATEEEALQAIKDYGDDYLTVLNIKK